MQASAGGVRASVAGVAIGTGDSDDSDSDNEAAG